MQTRKNTQKHGKTHKNTPFFSLRPVYPRSRSEARPSFHPCHGPRHLRISAFGFLSDFGPRPSDFERPRSFVIRHSSFLFAFLATILLTLCGCRTPQSLFTASGPDWHIQQGQALWRPQRGMPEIGGDLVLASDNQGRHFIQFDKTPMAIASAQVTSNRWLIKFPQRNLSFSGHGSGWTRFGWLYLPRALDGKPLPKTFQFERKPDGGWRLENSYTGESLEGFLSP